MNYVFLTLLIFFAIVGISQVVLFIMYRFCKIKDDNATVLVIPQIDKNFDVELTIRSVISKTRMLQSCGIKNIVCIDDDLDSYTKEKLSLLQKDFSYLSVMSKKAFKEKAGL
ncbi:MAG: hypothetical protein E7513_05515 [Ruminococcaceae bacterium]|nr:hypothetical protein [Oscillospiraceae bacterium]